jgi:hypothetical protein
MLNAFHHRIHGHEGSRLASVETTLITAGALILTLLTILLLFLVAAMVRSA